MSAGGHGALGNLLALLESLDRSRIWYRLEHIRDSVMVFVAVPGERWEIEFFPDAHVEVERFRSTGEIEDARVLASLIEKYGDR